MLNEKLATLSAAEVSDAQTAHYRIDDDIIRALRNATLDQKRAALEKINELLSK